MFPKRLVSKIDRYNTFCCISTYGEEAVFELAQLPLLIVVVRYPGFRYSGMLGIPCIAKH